MQDEITPALEADATTAVAEKAATEAKDPKTPETTDAAEKSEPEAAEEPAKAEEAQEKPPRDKEGRFQKRVERLNEDIASLTATKRQTERELTDLVRRAESLRRDLSTRPNLDPADFEGQDLHRVRTAVKAEKLAETIDAAKQLQERAQAERYETFTKKVEVAREHDPDLEEALEAFWTLPVSDHAADIIAESDVAPQLAKYLAKHPREAKEIMALPPHKQGLALARIEGRLAAPPPVRKVSQAPAPVPTLGGSQATAAKEPAKMSVEEMQKFLLPKLGRR